MGASRTAWQREENAAASSMQRALSPPLPTADASTASTASTASSNVAATASSSSSTTHHHLHHHHSRSSPRRPASPGDEIIHSNGNPNGLTYTAVEYAVPVRSRGGNGLRERSSSEPGDQGSVLEALASGVRIPALKLPGSLSGDAGAASERVRRSSRGHNAPQVVHIPRSSRGAVSHLASGRSPRLHSPRTHSARSPRSPRSPRVRSPRRRRGTVVRHSSRPDVAAPATSAAAATATASSEGGGAGGGGGGPGPFHLPAIAALNGGSGGSIIVPASPRGLVKRGGSKLASPRSRSKARATFDGMPDVVLLTIFSYLPIEDVVLRVSLLNYRCYQLSQNPVVFESVDLSRQSMTDEAFVDLLCELGWSSLQSLAPPATLTSRGLNALATCRSLHFLHLRNNPKISSHLLQRVVEYAEWQLRTIDLTGIIVTDDVVLSLADRFDHCLESITLVQMTPLAVTDRSVAHLLRQCSALRHLSLRSCQSITFDAFADIASKQLSAIDVADCGELDDRFLKRLLKHAPLLRSLVLSGLARITDKPLLELLRACTQLRDLALAECALLSDALLTTLTRKCQFSLRSLDLVGLPLLTAGAVVPFVEKQCAQLQRCRISHSPADVCEAALRALAKLCTATLTFLDLRQGDDATTLAADALALLPRFRHVRHLDVSHCGENVSSTLLGDLFAALPWLQALYADRCTGLTNQLVRKLMVAFEREPFDTKLGSLALFESISLIGCDNVSREALLDAMSSSRPRCTVTIH